mmetsp:Transcript_1257/g.3456  ORF Transcript_1257/g.3456 Transcript_1257/m.3456 type:complete len:152 (-) Transcript_1257:38-493(-)
MWAALLIVLIITYPLTLVRDEELREYQLRLFFSDKPIRLPFGLITRVVCVGPQFGGFGYCRISTVMLPLIFRPTIGAEVFVAEHSACLQQAVATMYGSTSSSTGAKIGTVPSRRAAHKALAPTPEGQSFTQSVGSDPRVEAAGVGRPAAGS